MRAEDIVDVSFFAVLIAGVVIAIAGSRTSLAPRRRALWRGCGLGLIGGALLAFVLASVLFIHNSPRPVVVGNLWDIREFSGRGSNSSRFRITDATGHAVQIRCKYRGPGLVEGERARVRYVEYNGNLLELDMLSGPFQMWHLRESSGEAGCWIWAAMGAVCGFFGCLQLAKAREAQAARSAM